VTGHETTLSDDFDPLSEDEEIDVLKEQIKAALERAAQKEIMIRERDARISDLQKQIANLEGGPEQEDPELVTYYKEQYEATAYQFEKLKEALSARPPASARRMK
jgi:chromosome segregation ATPase